MTIPRQEDLKLPDYADLAVLYAEPINLDLDAPSWGWTPLPWSIMDDRLTVGGSVGALMEEITKKVIGGTKLVFFLTGSFDLWDHIDSVSDNPDEISALSRYREPPDPRSGRSDILLVRDLPSLRRLAMRSELFRLLLDATAGQADDESWCYFLGHPSMRADWLFPSILTGGDLRQ